MPSEGDVRSDDCQDLWDSCFVIYLYDDGKVDHDRTYLGKNILDAYRYGLSEDDDHIIISPDINCFMQHHRKILDNPKPLLEEGEFNSFLLGTVKYRQCLLPLGENGKITAILGGMHFKNFLPSAQLEKIGN